MQLNVKNVRAFSATQILREINFVEIKGSKTAILEAPNFVNLVNFSLKEVQKSK